MKRPNEIKVTMDLIEEQTHFEAKLERLEIQLQTVTAEIAEAKQQQKAGLKKINEQLKNIYDRFKMKLRLPFSIEDLLDLSATVLDDPIIIGNNQNAEDNDE